MKTSFDHEKLDVYQESIRFVSWGDELLEKADAGKAMLVRIVSMLVGLIRSTSPSRVHEDSANYSTSRSESNSDD